MSDAALTFKLYPNPVVSKLYIETIEAAGIINVEVIDASGAILFEQHVNPKLHLLVVSMEKFHSGIYFIRLTNNEHEVVTKKIIKI